MQLENNITGKNIDPVQMVKIHTASVMSFRFALCAVGSIKWCFPRNLFIISQTTDEKNEQTLSRNEHLISKLRFSLSDHRLVGSLWIGLFWTLWPRRLE